MGCLPGRMDWLRPTAVHDVAARHVTHPAAFYPSRGIPPFSQAVFDCERTHGTASTRAVPKNPQSMKKIPFLKQRFAHQAILSTALAGLVGELPAAVALRTSIGNGADTFLPNDDNRGPNTVNGASTVTNLRYNINSRSRQPLIRFDLSSLDPGSDLIGATLSLTFTRSNRARTVSIYGLRDETLDSWSEATTTYNNAPGASAAAAGNYAYDIYNATTNPTGKWQLLGTFAISNAAVPYSNTSNTTSLPLDSFLAADTNNLVSFLIISGSDSAPDWDIATKENSTNNPPILNLPNANSSDSDGDGLADDWEITNFGDLSKSGSDDSDTANGTLTGTPQPDGFTNEQEETAGSNPLNSLSTPTDIDADGLADLWEDQYFGNNDTISTPAERALQNGSGDPDNDKGTNLQEQAATTAPNDRSSFLDSDADGLNDWWEVVYFTDTVIATSSTGDNDGDTVNNTDEYLAFSNPNNVNSIPGDIDGDDVPDTWEDRYYGNNNGIVNDTAASLAELAISDGTGDPDNDGFTDLVESTATPLPSAPNNAASVPGDSDGDDLGDAWELNFFGNVTSNNGLHDPDGDLYTNEEEENNATDPTDKNSFVDSDNDFMNDRWEITSFGSLTVSDDPSEDTDNDGVFNEDEYLDGSNPNDANSVPGDTDGDGLTDTDEVTFFGDIYTYDGNDDPDRDYSTNLQEQEAGTNPNNRAISPDDDFDGLGDGWEIFSFGDLTTTEDPLDDNDLDGFNNAAEYAAATSGNDPLDTPDTDGDGLPEGYEISVWGSATTQTGANDSDSDGFSNRLEYLVGTDPDDINSIPSPTELTSQADGTLLNDALAAPTTVNSSGGGIEIRYNNASRLRLAILRFNINGLSGDLSKAMLRLNVTGAPRTRALAVYGLADGSANEGWDESTISYANAPGIRDADRGILNVFARDPQKLVRLGSFNVTQGVTGIHFSDPNTLNLTRMLEDDTDGQITLVFFEESASNESFSISSKEAATGLAPTLIAPFATLTPPSNPVITGANIDTVAGTFTLSVSGLSAGTQWHVEGSTNLGSFTAISGSTFTATGSPQDVVIPTNVTTDPKRFFRLKDGVAP